MSEKTKAFEAELEAEDRAAYRYGYKGGTFGWFTVELNTQSAGFGEGEEDGSGRAEEECDDKKH